MTVRSAVPLSTLTTLGVGGPARFVIDCASAADVYAARALARALNLPTYVLGGGSNTLAEDAGYAGVVLRMTVQGVAEEQEKNETLLIAGAGVPWDALVTTAARKELWGMENLAGIPGSAGAAPVQNIGAYGTELAETFAWLDAVPPEEDRVVRLFARDLSFGYRDSRLKREAGWVALRIALRLSRAASPRLSYKDLAARKDAGDPLATPAEVGRAVRAIRAGKFPDLAVSGTAGSFFKNPVVSAERARSLASAYEGLPVFPAGEGKKKISLAWLLDRALGLKGFSVGGARLFEKQPIVIVTENGATAREVNALADEVARRVRERFGIVIEREVRALA